MRPLSLTVLALLFLACLVSPSLVQAQPPDLINYQARLLDGTNLVNGSTTMVFKVYNVGSGGSELYADTQTVVVVDGLYSVQIGASNATPGGLAGTLTNAAVYLAVCIDTTELSPRERMISVPYALVASSLSGASAGDFVMKTGDTMSGTLNNSSTIAAGRYTSASNTASAAGAIALGGSRNTASGIDSTVGGGLGNMATGMYATVAGGHTNRAYARRAFIGGGWDNRVHGVGGTIAGGFGNGALGYQSFIGGGEGNGAFGSESVVVGGLANGARGNESFVGSGLDNDVDANSSSIVGGRKNRVVTNSPYSFIGGGDANHISSNSPYAVISGGASNTIQYFARGTTIGGGIANRIDDFAYKSVIAGGWSNAVGYDGTFNVIGGGAENRIAFGAFGVTPSYAAIGGGEQNKIGLTGHHSVIPGGRSNSVWASYGFAAGYRAKVNHHGSFVWADLSQEDFGSSTANQFLVRASGGVGINITNGTEALTVAGNAVVTGSVTASKFIGDGSMLTGLDLVGIDHIVWVATNGTSAGPGTIEKPYRTPQQGYDAAAGFYPGKPSAVAIAAGAYGSLTMDSSTVHVIGFSRPELSSLSVSAPGASILGKQRVENVIVTGLVTVATTGGDVKFHNTRMEASCVVGGMNIEIQDCYITTEDLGAPALWIGGFIGGVTNVGVYQSSIRNATIGDPIYGLAFGIGALTIGTLAPATTGFIDNVEVIGCEIVNDSGAGAAILCAEAAVGGGMPVRLFAHNYIKGPPPGFGVPAVADPFVSGTPTIAFNNNTVFGDLGSAPGMVAHAQYYMNNSVYGLALFPGAGLVGWVQAGMGTGPDGAGNTQHELAFPVLPSLWND